MKKYRVGLIGCGAIASHYLRFAKEEYSDYFEIVALGDINLEKARERSEKYGVLRYGLPEIVYDDPTIDLVITKTHTDGLIKTGGFTETQTL